MARNKGRRPAEAPKPTPDSAKPANGAKVGERSAAPAATPERPAGLDKAAEPPKAAKPAAGAAEATAPRPSTAPRASQARGSGPTRGTATASGGGGGDGKSSYRSLRNGLIGGLIGGVVAALALTFYLRPSDGDEVSALESRVGQLEQGVNAATDTTAALDALTARVAALEAAPAGADEALSERVAALEQADLGGRVEALENAAPAVDETLAARVDALEAGASPSELASRLEKVEAALAAGGTAAGEAGAGTVALEQRLSELENRVAEVAKAGPAASDLRERLAALESQVASLAAAPGAGEGAAAEVVGGLVTRLDQLEAALPDPAAAEQIAARVAEISDRMAELTGSVADLDQRLAASEQLGQQVATLGNQLAGVGDRTGALGNKVEGLGDQITALRERADALAIKVDELSGRVSGAEAEVAGLADGRERAAALALLTTQLDTAIARSEPYESTVQSLAALGGDDATIGEAVAKLEPTAASGVPSLETLRRSFAEIAGDIVQRARAPEGDGVWATATSNLLGLVKVRPIGGDVGGDDPAARVARAEARLTEGDLGAAVAELEQLEGPAAEAAAGWLEQARSRLQAEAALAELQTRTTNLLSGAS